jgi:hypothetical protein
MSRAILAGDAPYYSAFTDISPHFCLKLRRGTEHSLFALSSTDSLQDDNA